MTDTSTKGKNTTNRTMSSGVFEHLMKVCELDSDSEDGHIIVTSHSFIFDVCFYQTQGSEMIVDDFGFWNSGQWNVQVPTPEQLEVMKNKITEKSEEFNSKQISTPEEDVRQIDLHSFFGLTIKDFI